MAGFGRREIEYMQALYIYNKYIESYSVLAENAAGNPDPAQPRARKYN